MGILEGKVVLITGGGNGIGREAALYAAREGASVVVNDLGGSVFGGDDGAEGPAEEVARLICDEGGKAVSNADSITSLGNVEKMVQQALDAFGGLHAVINPAGILRDGMFHKMAEDSWDRVIEVHLRGTFNVCRATIEHFREQSEGAYVLFTSGSGLVGNVGQANYGAAKMGIAGLSRIIALENASKNIRSNCIAPIAFTRMTATIPVKDEATAERRRNMEANMRADQPARLAVALVSDAARSVSGQIFGSRGDELTLYSQPRPIESLTRDEGWSIEAILSDALPTMSRSFYPTVKAPPQPIASAAAKS